MARSARRRELSPVAINESTAQEVLMASGQTQSTSFLVHLDGLDVPEKQRAELERAIQGAVLNEVARFDFGAAVGVRIPRREWLGIWLERLGGRDIPMPKITFGGR